MVRGQDQLAGRRRPGRGLRDEHRAQERSARRVEPAAQLLLGDLPPGLLPGAGDDAERHRRHAVRLVAEAARLGHDPHAEERVAALERVEAAAEALRVQATAQAHDHHHVERRALRGERGRGLEAPELPAHPE